MLFRGLFVWIADWDRVMEVLAAAIGILCRRSDPGGYLCLRSELLVSIHRSVNGKRAYRAVRPFW